MSVTVWSEREGRSGWTDCGQCAYLMTLRFAGFEKFPLGANTDAEREAFEDADDRLDETGSSPEDNDLASSRRYGVVLERLATGLEWRDIVGDTDCAFAIAGLAGNFPYGHRLRRWSPNFTGRHGVCIHPLGDGSVLWLDPEAPMGFAGDIVTTADVLRFTGTFDAHWYARRGRIGMFAPAPEDPVIIAKGRVLRTTKRPLFELSTKPGTKLYAEASCAASFAALPETHWVVLVGTPSGHPDVRAVLLDTGKFGEDSIVYMRSTDVVSQRDRPDPQAELLRKIDDLEGSMQTTVEAAAKAAAAEAVKPYADIIEEIRTAIS